MKLLTIIVHTDVQGELADLLRSIKQVPGFTFTPCAGHGAETERDPYFAAREQAIGHVPRVRTDILLQDNDVDAVLAALCSGDQCVSGQGIYWVTPVEKTGRLR